MHRIQDTITDQFYTTWIVTLESLQFLSFSRAESQALASSNFGLDLSEPGRPCNRKKCNHLCNLSSSDPSHSAQRDAIPWEGYPIDVSSVSLDWGGDLVLELSTGSGLRKPQVVRSIRIAGSIFKCLNIGDSY